MGQVFIDNETWQDYFRGWEIVAVAVRDRNILHLCARKSISPDEASHLADHEIPTKIVGVYLDEPRAKVNGQRENIGGQELSGMKLPVLGVSRKPFPRPGGLVSARNADGDTWPFGGGSGPMEQIAPGQHPFPNRLKCINGFTYAVCYPREIYKRIAVGKWEPYGTIPCPKQELDRAGFNDMDAFSESDMYAVGGHGDVWHFDGSQWRRMGFPSDVQLATITCAADGNVYVSGEGGSLWIGEKSTWKCVHKGESSLLWNDAVWFDNKLWLASDYQFRIWNGKELEPVTHNGERVFINGHMDAYDGVLAIASSSVMMIYDGNEWRTIVAPY